MSRFLLVTMGTRGYTLPFLSIGARLRKRGHEVTLIAEHGYADQAAAAGIDYCSLYGADEAEAVARDRRTFLHTPEDLEFLKRHTVGWNQRILAEIAKRCGGGLTVLSADRNTVWADLHARDYWNVSVVRAAVDLPKLDNKRSEARPWQTEILKECDALWGDDIYGMYRRVRPTVDSIALWPGWLVPESRARAFGFMPVLEPGCDTGQRDHLVFVAGTDGSLDGWVDRFKAASNAACAEIRLRGMILGSGSYVPLASALRGSRAIVHHGGIGTIAASLEAGVPQLVIPRVAGQHANAAYLARQGLCSVMRAEDWTPENASMAIMRVMDADGESVRKAAARIDREASLTAVCDYLEGK